ncbi:hypothetical protein MVEN_02170200 [Mycena venus]|uniref:Cell wall protein n=1 Tax=Mycena venus TaxID=2733690 RepID=A0A8H6X8M5_9AGAR|nr:hypothetical protein MVEN_02170200 [Mycena venus]
MARMILSLVSSLYVFQALAAPVPRAASSNPACQTPNTQISNAAILLGGINPIADIRQAGPLLNAQLAILNASNIASVIAGFGPHIGTVPVAIDSNSQGLIISALQDAQTNLAAVGIIPGATSDQVVKNLQKANSTVAQALVSAQAINSDCLAAAGSASAGSVSATPPTFGTFEVPGSAATTVAPGAPGSAATVSAAAVAVSASGSVLVTPPAFGTLGAPGSAATTDIFVVPAALYGRDSDDLYA